MGFSRWHIASTRVSSELANKTKFSGRVISSAWYCMRGVIESSPANKGWFSSQMSRCPMSQPLSDIVFFMFAPWSIPRNWWPKQMPRRGIFASLMNEYRSKKLCGCSLSMSIDPPKMTPSVSCRWRGSRRSRGITVGL